MIITSGILFILRATTPHLRRHPPHNPKPDGLRDPLSGDYRSTASSAAVFSALVIVLLMVFLKRTRYGLWIRATTQDHETAMNMGIPVQAVYAITFCMGAALAGLGGVLAAPISSSR